MVYFKAGLTKEEIIDCKKSGITPEEWVNDKSIE